MATIEEFLSNAQVYGVKYEPVAAHKLTEEEKKMYSGLRIQQGQFGLQACLLLAGQGRTRLLSLDRKSKITAPGDYPIGNIDISLNEYAQLDKHTVCIEASSKK